MVTKQEYMLHISTIQYIDHCMDSKSISVRLPGDVIDHIEALESDTCSCRDDMLELKFGDWVGDKRALVCPVCGGIHLHQVTVEVFERDCEDDDKGLHITVEQNHTDVKYESLRGNPSPRRQGLMVEFYCEGCCELIRLNVYQHKGHTVVGWAH